MGIHQYLFLLLKRRNAKINKQINKTHIHKENLVVTDIDCDRKMLHCQNGYL